MKESLQEHLGQAAYTQVLLIVAACTAIVTACTAIIFNNL